MRKECGPTSGLEHASICSAAYLLRTDGTQIPRLVPRGEGQTDTGEALAMSGDTALVQDALHPAYSFDTDGTQTATLTPTLFDA